MKSNYQNFFKPQPSTKESYEKMNGWKITFEKGQLECRPVSRKPKSSPVVGEKAPAWDFQVHARERNGKPFISGIMHLSLREFSSVIMFLILAYCRRTSIDPKSFLNGCLNGVTTMNNSLREIHTDE